MIDQPLDPPHRLYHLNYNRIIQSRIILQRKRRCTRRKHARQTHRHPALAGGLWLYRPYQSVNTTWRHVTSRVAASSASSAQDARKKKLGAGSLSTAPRAEPGPCHAKWVNSLIAPEAWGYTPGATHAPFCAWAGGEIVRAQSFGWTEDDRQHDQRAFIRILQNWFCCLKTNLGTPLKTHFKTIKPLFEIRFEKYLENIRMKLLSNSVKNK